MKILFIGGSGNISSACTKEALKKGHEVFHFNRGRSNKIFESKVKTIIGDINKQEDRKKMAEAGPFDVVANFIAFVPEQVQADIELFKGICNQYIFISSATVYQKPPCHYIIREDDPLDNPYWQYARDKISCENILTSQDTIPYTIVRPSFTYCGSWIPVGLTANSYSPVYRMRNGKPVISHGDGESLWVNTHASDFAAAFVGLFGNAKAINEAFHITSDEVLTWDAIYRTIGKVINCEPKLIHITSDVITKYYPEWGDGLLGDKCRSVVFDNSKIKSAVPGWSAKISFEEGVRRSISWFEEKAERMILDKETEDKMDFLIQLQKKIL